MKHLIDALARFMYAVPIPDRYGALAVYRWANRAAGWLPGYHDAYMRAAAQWLTTHRYLTEYLPADRTVNDLSLDAAMSMDGTRWPAHPATPEEAAEQGWHSGPHSFNEETRRQQR